MDEAADVPASGVALDEGLVIDEMNSCVREVIDSLPGDYRTSLILHDLEEMSLAQTAEISSCTLAAAKIRVHRARRRLKTALARQCEFYRDTENVLRCERG